MINMLSIGFHSDGNKVDSVWETKWSPAFKCWIRVPKNMEPPKDKYKP